MTAHRLLVRRTNLGRSTVAGPSGPFYGTIGKCSCGEWSERRNIAPSKGGRAWIEARHAAHVTESSSQ